MYVVTSRKSIEKKWRKLKYVQMTTIYTKYKAENNALLTIYVKYGLKIYWEVWKFELGKVWNFKKENG